MVKFCLIVWRKKILFYVRKSAVVVIVAVRFFLFFFCLSSKRFIIFLNSRALFLWILASVPLNIKIYSIILSLLIYDPTKLSEIQCNLFLLSYLKSPLAIYYHLNMLQEVPTQGLCFKRWFWPDQNKNTRQFSYILNILFIISLERRQMGSPGRRRAADVRG